MQSCGQPGTDVSLEAAVEPQLVLASSSPRRRELLAQYGYRTRIVPAAVIESSAAWLTVRELVLLNAGRKAAFVASSEPGSVVLGVDTLVSLDGQALGKPATHADAAAMLKRFAGREHQVYSGVCLMRQQPAHVSSFVSVTNVHFRQLSSEEIETYLKLIDPLDKAGGYAAQEHGSRVIAHTDGSTTNVIGLPMESLTSVLAQEYGIVPDARSL